MHSGRSKGVQKSESSNLLVQFQLLWCPQLTTLRKVFKPLAIFLHNLSRLKALEYWFILIYFSSYGSGSRIKLPYTRKIIDAIHAGSLLNVDYTKTEVFGLEIPSKVEGVASEILDPMNAVSLSLVLFYQYYQGYSWCQCPALLILPLKKNVTHPFIVE